MGSMDSSCHLDKGSLWGVLCNCACKHTLCTAHTVQSDQGSSSTLSEQRNSCKVSKSGLVLEYLNYTSVICNSTSVILFKITELCRRDGCLVPSGLEATDSPCMFKGSFMLAWTQAGETFENTDGQYTHGLGCRSGLKVSMNIFKPCILCASIASHTNLSWPQSLCDMYSKTTCVFSIWCIRFWVEYYFLTALIDIFILTIRQMTIWNVKVVACWDEPTENYNFAALHSSTEPFSIVQLILQTKGARASGYCQILERIPFKHW